MYNKKNTKIFLFVFLLFFILPNYLFAGSIDNLTNIYTYGDVGYMKYIFTALQKAFTSSAYQNLLDVVSVIAVVMIGIRGYREQSLTAFIKHAALPAAIIGLLHYPVTVHIEDQRQVADLNPGTTYYSESDGVPSLLAVMFGSASTFQTLGIKLVNEATKTVQPSEKYSTANLGFANAMGNLVNLTDIALRPGFTAHDTNTTEYMRGLKAYTLQCVLQEAVARNPKDINYLKNPTEDIIDSIEANNLGLTSSDKIQYNGTTTSCEDFWTNNLHDKESNIADTLFSKAKKMLSFNLDNAYTGINQVGDIDLNSSVLSSSLGKLKAYTLNSATIASINSAISQNNNGLTTGVDFANAVTAQASLSNMQLGGVGIAKWFAMVAPYVLHILLGVIYFYGLFVPLMAMVLGWDAGIKYLLSYFGGLLGFAAVGIGMAISNDLVSYFAAKHAVELVASLGGNPATVSGISQYYMDMATYTGVIGFLGVAIATIAPALILKGQSSAAISAIGSFSSMYKGGVDNAEGIAADNIGAQKAYEQEQEDIARQKLSKMGITDIPSNMGAAAFYDKIYNSEVQHNKEYGTYDQKSHLAQAAQMAKYSTEEQIGAAYQAGSMISAAGGGQAAFNAGRTQGAMQAGQIEADSLHVNDIKALNSGSQSQEGRKLGSIVGYGKNINEKEAFNAGKFAGISMAAEDKRIANDKNLEGDARTLGHNKADKTMMSAHALQKAQVYDKNGDNAHEHSKYMDGGTELQRKAINERELAMGAAMAGKNEKTGRQMMADIQAASAGKVLDDFSHAAGSRKTLDVSHDKDGYIDGVSNDKVITWKDKNGKTHSMSRATANKIAADAGIMGFLGKAAAIYNQTAGGTDMDIMANNAMGMEMGNIVGSNKAIEAAGGVEKFANLKGAESAVRTAETQKATISKIAEGLKHADSSLSNEQAQKMAKAIVEGSQEGANKFKEALGALGNLAGTLAGGKTRSDFRSVDTAGGSEGYKERMAKNAAGNMAKMASTQDFLDNENSKNGGYVGAMREMGFSGAADTMGKLAKKEVFNRKNMENMYQQLRDHGFSKDQLSDLLDSSGHVKTGWAAAAVMAEHAAGNLKGMHGLVFGNKAVGVSLSKDGTRVQSIDGSFKEDMSETHDNRYVYKNGVDLQDGLHADAQTLIALTGRYGGKVVDAAIAAAKNGNTKPFKNLLNNLKPDELNKHTDPKDPNYTGGTTFSDAGAGLTEVGGGIALAYGIDKKWNPKLDAEGKRTGRGRVFGKVQDKFDNLFGGAKSPSESLNGSTNSSHNDQPNEPQQNKSAHDDSFNKNIPNSTTKSENVKDIKGFSGKNTTESGIILPDNPKEPIPHVNAGEVTESESFAKRVFKEASHMGWVGKALSIAGLAALGYDVAHAKNQTDIGTTVDPFFASSIGNGTIEADPIYKKINSLSPQQQAKIAQSVKPVNIGQALTQQISTGVATNTSALASSPHHAVVKTVGGNVPITTNSGKLTIGGYATQVPANDYLNAMQNPQMRQQFSQMMAQSNLNGVYNPMTGIQANSMSALMQNLNKNASIVEPGVGLQQLEQMYGPKNQVDPNNDIAEIQKKNVLFNVNDTAEETSDMIYDLYDKFEDLNKGE